jgi:hypothetical protein
MFAAHPQTYSQAAASVVTGRRQDGKAQEIINDMIELRSAPREREEDHGVKRNLGADDLLGGTVGAEDKDGFAANWAIFRADVICKMLFVGVIVNLFSQCLIHCESSLAVV